MGSSSSVDRLKKIDPDKIPSVPYKGDIVPCRVCSVYDGDTCTVIMMLGKYPIKMRVRLMGIDAPEIRGSTANEKQAAMIVRDYLIRLIGGEGVGNVDKIAWLKVVGWDKYGGRILGYLYPNEYTNVSFSDMLLEHGYVKAYGGEKKTPWTTDELTTIITYETPRDVKKESSRRSKKKKDKVKVV